MAAASSDRKSTRLNSSHLRISYAVFCLKKKNDDVQRKRGHRCRKAARFVVSIAATHFCAPDQTSPIALCRDSLPYCLVFFFFFKDTAPPEIYTLSLKDALPI